ncbi:cobalamin-independent methionine synthase II family protein [Arthrobacter sp. zg-Y859]|uniref:Cobalamin-independent methionine synthase II family protein n=1 Tax=Arthrobacter jinronghuae TaxID=2964609 RepID=A0ABT1NL49_9MICC|nr:cobalamin-independent methionine synthase II family protein [Arthrobacter jinronghuae]MCQ1948451.1 cobalamin-independent methionine synthase II family protein [Arthrobacter jinronghuae]UWX78722.1 cobalamin-independent methionine synthase II family protein [Arthrobacter jinronghuae]
MRKSTDRILTTHAGSLPRTPELIAANAARETDPADTGGYAELLQAAVADLVRRQRQAGIDIPNDGEYGHAMSANVDYGAWWSYSFARLGGLSVAETGIWDMEPHRSEPGNVVLTSFGDRRDRQRFSDAYTDPTSGITTGAQKVFPKVTGPVEYTGYDAVASDIANLKSGLAAAGLSEGFLASLSPGSCSRIANEYYATEEEFIYACADAMREEYLAIVDAGLIVQIDDPSIAENWDQINPEPSVADYLKFTQIRVEALNYALRGLPEEQIRFHLCWGSWHGPHTTDIEFRHLVDTLLQINAGGYSFEAGNVRHEHEWRVWEDTKLPDGKVLIPGVVSHATNVVEHPELVADRIERFARLVGRENVIASTDCGLGGRVHPQIAAAKLETLGEGARLASSRLW